MSHKSTHAHQPFWVGRWGSQVVEKLYSKKATLKGVGCIGHCLLDDNTATKEFAKITASVESALFPHTKVTGRGWNVEVCHKPLVSSVEKRPWMGVVQARWSKLEALVAQRDNSGSVVPRIRLETLLQNNSESDEPTVSLNEVGNLEQWRKSPSRSGGSYRRPRKNTRKTHVAI